MANKQPNIPERAKMHAHLANQLNVPLSKTPSRSGSILPTGPIMGVGPPIPSLPLNTTQDASFVIKKASSLLDPKFFGTTSIYDSKECVTPGSGLLPGTFKPEGAQYGANHKPKTPTIKAPASENIQDFYNLMIKQQIIRTRMKETIIEYQKRKIDVAPSYKIANDIALVQNAYTLQQMRENYDLEVDSLVFLDKNDENNFEVGKCPASGAIGASGMVALPSGLGLSMPTHRAIQGPAVAGNLVLPKSAQNKAVTRSISSEKMHVSNTNWSLSNGLQTAISKSEKDKQEAGTGAATGLVVSGIKRPNLKNISSNSNSSESASLKPGLTDKKRRAFDNEKSSSNNNSSNQSSVVDVEQINAEEEDDMSTKHHCLLDCILVWACHNLVSGHRVSSN